MIEPLLPEAGNPFAIFSASGRQLLWFAILVPIALLVVWYARREFRRNRGDTSLRPAGRLFLRSSPRVREQAWRAQIARLEARPPTAIAAATRAPVRVVGLLRSASGNLGGPQGNECVWRNRAGARPQSAVGAELVILADETGRVGIEGIEAAFVIAPAEHHSHHHENVSLYLGDRVEVFGEFDPEPATGENEKATSAELVYGTLGARGPLEIRLVERAASGVPCEPTPS